MIGGSSSGRTTDSDSVSLGSNPSPPAIICYIRPSRKLYNVNNMDAYGRKHRKAQVGRALMLIKKVKTYEKISHYLILITSRYL